MNKSPDRPLLPLALALPRMLREIEAALATAGPGETRRLRRRAELLRGLLLQRTVGPGENPFRLPSSLATGTDGSNPSPSSGESINEPWSSPGAAPPHGLPVSNRHAGIGVAAVDRGDRGRRRAPRTLSLFPEDRCEGLLARVRKICGLRERVGRRWTLG